jgi:SulP family sulfate permease
MTAIRNFFKFDLSNFRGDLFGGITAGIVALPLALAFGEQTELGAIAGLYGAIAIAVLAAVFGGTPTQISGPTAPMTVVSAVVILEAIAIAGDLTAAFPIIIATFFLAGLLEMLLGVMGLGKYIKYIPYPVVSGFMSGIGIIIIISQIFPFFGAGTPEGGALGTITSLGTIPAILNWHSVLLAVITIAIIYVFPKFTRAVPSSLLAMILVTTAAFFIYTNGQVSVINDSTANGVPTGLPEVHLGFFGVFADTGNLFWMFKYGIMLALLGAIDSLLTSVVADNLTKTKHNSNQELIGQGIGNMGTALIGGLPGAGATMRTVINVNSGGKTKISGIIAGVLLLFVLLGLGSLVGIIPQAVLAGILITVGISIIDYKGFRHIRTIPKADAIIMVTVLLLTVFIGLLEAVAIGMVLAAILFMKDISDVIERRAEVTPLRDFSREISWEDEGDIIDRIGHLVYIKHLDGPLFFGFSSRFSEMVKALPDIKVVIIRMSKVPYIDQTGLYAMEEAIQDLQAQGITVIFTGLHGQPEDMFRRINLIPGLVPEVYNFARYKDAAYWLQKHLRDNDGKLPPLKPVESKVDLTALDLREI